MRETMKIFFLLCMTLIAVTSAWKVDRRCLEEGQMFVGDDVDNVLEIGNDEADEAVFLDDQTFDWEHLTAYDLQEVETTGLRGSSESFFRNESATFSNDTRRLQSGKSFNLKLNWQRGHCWQGRLKAG